MLTVDRPAGPYLLAYPAEKLAARGTLPGAFGFDQAAHSFRRIIAAGLAPAELLAPALPCSWMVNARAPSTVFARWLRAPLRGRWSDLIELLAVDAEGWLAQPPAARDAVAAAASDLAIDGHGATAISKVAAVLCPDAVPLMDDAAVWFALEGVACPQEPADQAPATVGPAWVVPMLDWFAAAVRAAEAPLAQLASAYTHAPLSPAQALDRLVWFESWGFRHSHVGARAAMGVRWWWVRDEATAREALVPVAGPHPARPAYERIALASVDDPAWRSRAQHSLDAAYGA